MKACRIITEQTTSGQILEIKIEMFREVQDDIIYADGWNVNVGRKIVDILTISERIDGKFKHETLFKPEKLNPLYFGNYNQLIAAGFYARLGNTYINEKRYNEIMTAISEMESELVDPEYDAIVAKKAAHEKAVDEAMKIEADEYAKKIANGFCPHCESYCYGDCQSSSDSFSSRQAKNRRRYS